MSIHARLLADTHVLGRVEISWLLLHRNAVVPWFILVPDCVEPEFLALPLLFAKRCLTSLFE